MMSEKRSFSPHDHAHTHNSWNNDTKPPKKRFQLDYRDGTPTTTRLKYHHKHAHYAGHYNHHKGDRAWDSERDQHPLGEWGSGNPYRWSKKNSSSTFTRR